MSDAALPRIVALEMLSDGLLGASRLFFDAVPLLKRGRSGTCDGLKVDVHGNIFASVPGGVAVLSPEGEQLGTIRIGLTWNCGWGDDGTALYITADDHDCRIPTVTQGTPLGSR